MTNGLTEAPNDFTSLGLNEKLLKALKLVGYESPSPIQAKSIPPLLEGRDILGQAQTGTGKTAAFALPILHQINLRQKTPQAMILAPTRELAIQVAEAMQSYAHYLSGFHVLPIYGGQGYEGQIRGLKRGVQVVVGTPGRVMDHMRKGTLKLDNLKHLVLDEADEMLRMGFIDDVEWILEKVPEQRQIALFSATMPTAIAKVASTYLNQPVEVHIQQKTTTAASINQRYWPVSGLHKLDALTRILEVETFDAMIVFVRTKTATVELAEKLEARGFSSAALNGDISQHLRERTIDRLKTGKIDILVATDVAARGLDVERISHVVNYDIPYDTESYVHRIGRTGRAGRSGEAILFVAKREMRMLRAIERATGKTIEPMRMPSTSTINEQRVKRFKQSITDLFADKELDFFKHIIEELQQENACDALTVAAALAKLAQGDQPLLLDEKLKPQNSETKRNDKKQQKAKHYESSQKLKMVSYRMEVGLDDGAKPGNIVGAIANEAGIESQFIRKLSINADHSTVELPAGMPSEIFNILQKARVCGKALRLKRLDATARPHKKRKNAKTQDAISSASQKTKSDKQKSGSNSSKSRKKPKKAKK